MDLQDASVALVSDSPDQIENDLAWLGQRVENLGGAKVEHLVLRPCTDPRAGASEKLLLFCDDRDFDVVVFANAAFPDHPVYHAILRRAARLANGLVVLPITLNTINDMMLAGLSWCSPLFHDAEIRSYPGLDCCLVMLGQTQPPSVNLLDWYLQTGRSLNPEEHCLVLDALKSMTALDRKLRLSGTDDTTNELVFICHSPLAFLAALGLRENGRPNVRINSPQGAAIAPHLRTSLQQFGFTLQNTNPEMKTQANIIHLGTVQKLHPDAPAPLEWNLCLEHGQALVETTFSTIRDAPSRTAHLYKSGLGLPEEEAKRLVEVESVQRSSIDILAKNIDCPARLYTALRPFSERWHHGWRTLIRWLRSHGYRFAHQHRAEPEKNEKTVCFRYDVHVRDIAGAWSMLALNNELGVPAEYHLLWRHGIYETRHDASFSALAAHSDDLAVFGLHASLLDHHLIWQFFDGHEGNFARALDGPRRDEFISLLRNPNQLQSYERQAQERFTELHGSFESICAPCRCFSYHGSFINWLLRERHWSDFCLNKLVLSLQGERLLQEAVVDKRLGRESDNLARAQGFGYVSDNSESEAILLQRLYTQVATGSSFLFVLHPALFQRGCISFNDIPL